MKPLSSEKLLAQIDAASSSDKTSQSGPADQGAQGVTEDFIDRACGLARIIQERAVELQTPAERRQQAELDRMLQHPEDKVTLTQMTDQGFRSRSPDRAVDQLIHILDVQGIPRFFSQLDRALLRGFQSFGNYLPGVAVPMVKDKMRKETSNVILPAEPNLLREHLSARRDEGIRMNVNFLGEAPAGRGRSPTSARKISLGLAAARDRSRLGQNIDALFADIAARTGSHAAHRR